MSKTIKLSITLPAKAAQLFEMYTDPKKHKAITGAPVKVSAKADAPFSAFGGKLLGKTLCAVPNKQFVQTWRSKSWKVGDTDSILVLTFSQKGKKARIDLVHANVPDHDARAVKKGWKKFYWKPWKKYLKAEEKGEGRGSSVSAARTAHTKKRRRSAARAPRSVSIAPPKEMGGPERS